ncbi:hypothetical protein BATDEDRAFT_28391 [Batrachochytrium dendrobatidis JAM81]|uniref:Uncharacterized protein n=2 Tax=Batrachochytrium dendrobatidis TaxID=109871 RepID=F4PDV6_BATDJ|nr:uncharacterized protein BATDEDRAFT_28391 [Batrachochytrium dendrobatidis JAM81]EGF76464.1 hypothetical protein BATDEDRAFT_28391 [Batrachochytrium dendrobatidis JAM81]OAJ39157.1 hypothetical protein BDEG_23024 [Batrachochytrium dendrobatidis JEL423]|eukprot:XP_006682798.1 hypothetical protein BATDEDRAFT_28391 [Batrachochytrium dendrobatidis JAM81]
MASVNNGQTTSCEEWLMLRVGAVPRNSLGWFRCGVGFYNKKEFTKAIECFEKSVQLDPMNYNAYQIMARACIAVNRKDDAINALKQSVSLDNPSDWQVYCQILTSLPD